MIRPLLAAGLLALAAGCQNQPAETATANNAAAAEPAIKPAVVWLQSADKKSIRGDFYEADHAKALILLFHQAGSSKEEYARSEEHTSELQSLMRISYAVFCLKKKTQTHTHLQSK